MGSKLSWVSQFPLLSLSLIGIGPGYPVIWHFGPSIKRPYVDRHKMVQLSNTARRFPNFYFPKTLRFIYP